jgi:hypothetical protein
MRRTRIIVLCLVGACAAALPELGRCVKVSTPQTGGFVKENCIGVDKDKDGEFEWESGPGAKKGVKELLNSALLETTTGEKISCSNLQLTGEYTGPKSLKITKFLAQGCENVTHHTVCYTNPLAPAVIESEVPLVGELGAIPGSKTEANPWAGWDLKSEDSSLPIATFFCGEAKGMITFALEGSVIGRVTKTNLMQASFGLTYKQTAGIQLVKAFIGGSEDVLELTETLFGSTEKFTHQTGLAGAGALNDEEPLEIKAKI